MPQPKGRLKKTYRSKAKAKQAAIANNATKTGYRSYSYRCWHCGLWHLTHHEQTGRAA